MEVHDKGEAVYWRSKWQEAIKDLNCMKILFETFNKMKLKKKARKKLKK